MGRVHRDELLGQGRVPRGGRWASSATRRDRIGDLPGGTGRGRAHEDRDVGRYDRRPVHLRLLHDGGDERRRPGRLRRLRLSRPETPGRRLTLTRSTPPSRRRRRTGSSTRHGRRHERGLPARLPDVDQRDGRGRDGHLEELEPSAISAQKCDEDSQQPHPLHVGTGQRAARHARLERRRIHGGRLRKRRRQRHERARTARAARTTTSTA